MPEIRLKQMFVGDPEIRAGHISFWALLACLLGKSFSISGFILSSLFDTLWRSSVGGVCGVWVRK